MWPRVMRLTVHYETSLDRAGLALGLGSGLSGLLVLLLLLFGGQRDPLALAGGWLGGSLFAAVAMTLVLGPPWLVLHVAGLRRAFHAALLGLVGAGTRGFGLFQPVAVGEDFSGQRWAAVIAMGLPAALMAAGIAALMWRVAYRQRWDG
jgi:hypothetical protein